MTASKTTQKAKVSDEEVDEALFAYSVIRQVQHAVTDTKRGPSPVASVAKRYRELARCARELAVRRANDGYVPDPATLTITIDVGRAATNTLPTWLLAELPRDPSENDVLAVEGFRAAPGAEEFAAFIRAWDELSRPSGNRLVSVLWDDVWARVCQEFLPPNPDVLSVDGLMRLAAACDTAAERLVATVNWIASSFIKSRAENAAVAYLVGWQATRYVSTRRLANLLVERGIEAASVEQVRQKLQKAVKYRRRVMRSGMGAAELPPTFPELAIPYDLATLKVTALKSGKRK